jgi:mono/diheme cytochrome c family protein
MFPMMRMKLLLLTVVAAAGLAQKATALEPRAQRGLTLAQTNCTKCHAIGKVGESPMREAPPFRTLHERYPVEDLAEALAEGISTGHPAMPEWRFDPGQVGDLISYLKTFE